MSLFKIREFWTTQSEDDEYFDQNSLITTTLNSDSDFIISGSQSGVLRIYKPSCDFTENDSITGYNATDLIIEKILNYPILQLGCGRLVSGSQKLQIAVLHPRFLSVYTLKYKEGIAEHGTQNCLELLYEHGLRRSAANFSIGQFGGNQNRDFICVQSLDGMFSFFEQESFTFSCFIPDFLLPGPIAYVKKTDNFVTSNSSWCIVTYKYKLLSEAGEKSEENSSAKISYDWSFSLGEAVIDISVIDDFINKEAWIMVLGEKNLYCLKCNGKLQFMKRLDYSPICFITYVLDDSIFSLIVSETNTLLIYENTTLKWSAQLQFLPVSIRRAFLSTIKGALVLLSEEGRLECCYLGTEPSLFVAPPLAMKEIDFEKAEEELLNLNKSIRKSYGSDMKISNSNTEKELRINISVSPELEPCTFESNLKNTDNQQMCVITIDVLPQILFEEVQISVAAQRPLKVTPQVQFYNNLNERKSVTCYAFLDEASEIPSLIIEVSATVITNLGLPKTIFKSTMLPMKLVSDSCQAQKESQHKITLNINQSPVSLATLFPEYVAEDSLSQSGNAIGFKSVTGLGGVATILLAKSSERYRLQSDSFASLSLLIEQMIFRLEKHYSDKSDFNVSYSSSLPANEFILYVNNHFRKRQQAIRLQDDISQLSGQFRIVQKRLIAKFKVKNPMPLTNLEILLEDTHSEIINATEKLEQMNNELAEAQIELSCALNLIGNLIKHMDIDKSLKELLESTFSSNVYDLESQNWEDVMDASLCYLLRTALAKSEKDTLRAAHTSFEEIKDITKLEKHISQVMERIPKKGKELPKQDSTEEENQTVQREETPEKELKPIGSQFGESSSRLLSARKSLLRRRHKNDD